MRIRMNMMIDEFERRWRKIPKSKGLRQDKKINPHNSRINGSEIVRRTRMTHLNDLKLSQ